jgi:hypothetical protein
MIRQQWITQKQLETEVLGMDQWIMLLQTTMVVALHIKDE